SSTTSTAVSFTMRYHAPRRRRASSDGDSDAMGSDPYLRGGPPPPRRVVSHRETDRGRSRARRQREADSIPSSIARDPSGASQTVGRGAPAGSLAAHAHHLGSALWRVSQLP